MKWSRLLGAIGAGGAVAYLVVMVVFWATYTAAQPTTVSVVLSWSGVLVVAPALGIAVTWFVYRHSGPQPARRPSTECHKCGYDCRATPDRCPECGLQRPID